MVLFYTDIFYWFLFINNYCALGMVYIMDYWKRINTEKSEKIFEDLKKVYEKGSENENR